MCTYGKLNLLITDYINLVFYSLEMHKRLIQANSHYIFLPCLKTNVSQTFESNRCKKLFSKCVCYWYSLLWWVFFTPCDSQKTLCFIRIYFTQRIFATAMLLRSLKQVFWKRSLFYVCYLHNNIKMLLIPKFQTKASIC